MVKLMTKSLNIPVDNLPSKGYKYTVKSIEIPQMTFSSILSYQAEIEQCQNELSTFIAQLRCILMTLPDSEQLSLFDALPLIAIRVYASSCEQLTDYIKIKYQCPVHNKKETMEVRLKNMRFGDMDPLLKKIEFVKINDEKYKFKVPTVKEFLNIAELLKTRVPLSAALKYVYLMSMFEEAYNEKTRMTLLSAMFNATSKDIVTLNKLYQLITGAFLGFTATCNNGGESVTVPIDSIGPVTDIFQNILETEGFDETVLTLRENNEN